jgi:hypothetical protein
MLGRTEPVDSVVPRFERRVQSKRAAAPTSWTRRFARKSVAVAMVCSRSAFRAIAAMRIARRPVGRTRVGHPSGPRANAIVRVLKAVSIIAITSAPTAPA